MPGDIPQDSAFQPDDPMVDPMVDAIRAGEAHRYRTRIVKPSPLLPVKRFLLSRHTVKCFMIHAGVVILALSLAEEFWPSIGHYLSFISKTTAEVAALIVILADLYIKDESDDK